MVPLFSFLPNIALIVLHVFSLRLKPIPPLSPHPYPLPTHTHKHLLLTSTDESAGHVPTCPLCPAHPPTQPPPPPPLMKPFPIVSLKAQLLPKSEDKATYNQPKPTRTSPTRPTTTTSRQCARAKDPVPIGSVKKNTKCDPQKQLLLN